MSVKRGLGNGASSDAVMLILIRLVTMGLAFVVTRLLSQYLSTYDYGTYSQVILVSTTVASVTILGMIDGVNFFNCSIRDQQKREAYIATLFSLQCIVSTAAGMMLMLFGSVIARSFENPDLQKLMIFAAVLPLLQNLIPMLQVLLVSVGKARMLAYRNLTVSVIRLLTVIVTVTIVRDVALILGVTVLLDVLQIGLFVRVLGKNGCLISLRRSDFHLIRRILSYCIPMALFIIINSLNRDCDKYLIALVTDTETLAVYTNASKLLPFDIVQNSFCTVLQPRITRLVAEKKDAEARNLYKHFLEITYVSTVAMCGAALCVSPQLMELLYSAKYIRGLPVFCVYILVDMIRFTNITLILSAAGKAKKLMCLGIVSLGANVVLNIGLYAALGVVGPAIATLVVTLVIGAVMLWMSARELGIRMREFFACRYLVLFLAENGAVLVLLLHLRLWLERMGLHYVLILMLTGALYGGILLLLNGRRFIRNMRAIK